MSGLRPCLRTAAKGRVGTPELPETASSASNCRPGAPSGRIFKHVLRSTRAWALGVALIAECWVVRGEPTIEFTQVPAYGTAEDLTGRITEADPDTHRVAVLVYVPNAGWYSKPPCGAPLTRINAAGNWIQDITTGASDPFATEITALLVAADYDEPCVLGLPALPVSVTSQALASVSVVRHHPSVRLLHFSDYDWWVKRSTDLVGPGPNFFSDSTNNVW